MRQTSKLHRLISAILIGVLIFQFIPALPAEAANGQETIAVRDYAIETELTTHTLETIYDGTVVEKTYHNEPSLGYDYLLVQVDVTPNTPIPGDDFTIEIGGQLYTRVLDDAFLDDHGYEILVHRNIIAKASGWMVFEIPDDSADPDSWRLKNGQLTAQLQTADANLVLQEEYNGYTKQQSDLIALHQMEYAQGAYTVDNPYIVVNPFGMAPLTALVMFETDTPVEVTTTVVGKTERASISNTVSGYATHHELPIFGLYNGDNTVRIALKDEAGVVTTKEIFIATETSSIYIDSKQVSVEETKPEKLTDGLYVIRDNVLIIMDIYGDIRGYFSGFKNLIIPSGLDEITEDGHIIFSVDSYTNYATIYEIDTMGFIYHEVQVPTLAHHDALYVGGSRFLTTDYYIDLDTGVMSAGIPWREIFNSANGSAEVRTYGESDWLHANTISWCGDDAILVSSRNQHAVAKLSYPDFEVQWILSVNPNASPWNADKYLTPVGDDFEWFYSQHHVQLLTEETYDGSGVYEITLFDNGVHRGLDPNGVYPEEDMYSRMVCYRIDENNMTVEQVWDYGQELGVYTMSPVHGSTAYIIGEDTATYLGNFDAWSRRISEFEDMTEYPTSIIEVTTDKETVFHIRLYDDSSYRTHKLPAEQLYPKWSSLTELNGKYVYVADDAVLYNGTPIEGEPALYDINLVSATQNYINIAGWAANQASLSGGYEAAKLLLTNQSTGERYVYQMDIDNSQIQNSDLAQEIIDQLGINTGFSGKRLNISTLASGAYQISILIQQNGNEYLVNTEKVLQIGAVVDKVPTNDVLVDQQSVSSTLHSMAQSNTYSLQSPYVAVDPYGLSPLSAIAVFATTNPASITISVAGKNGADTLTQNFETVSTEHYIPIYGLYAGESTSVNLTAHYQDGTSETSTISVTGNYLPSNFVPVNVSQADTTQMADGWTFVMAGSLQGYVYAIDEAGSVRWMFSEPGLGAASVFLPLENGNYLIGGDKSFGQYYKYNLFELDLTGRIVNEYLIDGYHHDACELPSGNLLLYANNVNGKVVEDTLYELDRTTGAILHTWDLNSYFNVGNYNEAGEHISDVNYGADTHDWLHTNGMAYDATTNSILISARHQDAVFSMNLDTGKINWILSDPNDLWPEYLEERLLSPVGDGFEWQYGQHNISLLPNGDILLFDNGDYRSKTTDGVLDAATQSYSRAVIYRINQQNMTVEQIWQFGKELGTTPYSAYVSSVQYLGENHYLIDFGGIVKNAQGEATYNIMDGVTGSSQSQIYEVMNNEVIFHAGVERSGLLGNSYRAVRMTPYTVSTELNLTSPNRLGSLYTYGLATAIDFNADDAVVGGPEVDLIDNGVQLLISATLDQSAAPNNLALIFDGVQDYQIALPSSASIAYTLNKSEIPAGVYHLYFLVDGTAYDLALEWNNTTTARPMPAAYQIEVTTSSVGKGVVYGSGVYYSNTPFTVWVRSYSDAEFIGWYANGELLSTDKTYSITATQNMVITAMFAGDEESVGDGGSTGDGGSVGGGGSAGGGGGSAGGGGGTSSGQVEEITNPDGTVTTIVTNADGSSTETTVAADGSYSVVTIHKDGNVEATVQINEDAVHNTSGRICLPMRPIVVTKELETAPTIVVTLPVEGSISLEIPIQNITAGTVAFLVKPDGTVQLMRDAVVTEKGLAVTLSNGDIVKLVDNSKEFTDVASSFWGADDIAYVTSRGLFDGVSATTFAPDANMSRAMIVTVLARLEGVDTATGSTWYEAGRQWAMEQGISDGSNMEGNLTREQIATMLYRYAGSPAVSGTITGFTDGDSVSSWATDAMIWAVDNGIIVGSNGSINAQGLTTRAQVAAMLKRFLLNIEY